MSLSNFTENLNIHQSLPNQPALSPEELKQEFDKAANLIKAYLNGVLLPQLNEAIASLQEKGSSTESVVSNLKTTVEGAVRNITNLQSSMNTRITDINTLKTNVSNLQKSVNTANTNITSLQNKVVGLKSGATTKISKGSTVPSSLADGEVYFQYF